MIVRVSNGDDFGKSRYFGEKYKSETRRDKLYSQIWPTAQWVQIEIIYCASKIDDLEFGDT